MRSPAPKALIRIECDIPEEDTFENTVAYAEHVVSRLLATFDLIDMVPKTVELMGSEGQFQEICTEEITYLRCECTGDDCTCGDNDDTEKKEGD